MRLFVAPRPAVGAAPSGWRCWRAAASRRALGAAGELPPHAALHRRDAGATAPRRSTTRWPALRAPRLRADAGGASAPSPRAGAARAVGWAWSATRRSTICRARSRPRCSAAGLEPERRRFSPHVTLARLDSVPEAKLAAFVQAHNLFRAEPVPVEHFTLFSSRSARSRRSIRRRWSMRWGECRRPNPVRKATGRAGGRYGCFMIIDNTQR